MGDKATMEFKTDTYFKLPLSTSGGRSGVSFPNWPCPALLAGELAPSKPVDPLPTSGGGLFDYEEPLCFDAMGVLKAKMQQQTELIREREGARRLGRK